MSQLDENPSTFTAGADGPQPLVEVGSASVSAPSLASPLLTWLLVLVAGVIAGLAGFGIGEAGPTVFEPSYEVSPELRKNPAAARTEVQRRMVFALDQSAALAYGGLGAVLGLALGVAGGVARRSPRAALAAGITGLILGGAAGAGTTIAALPYYHAARAKATDENYNEDLVAALCTHGAIWLTVGVAAGLALGIGLGNGQRIARAVLGGILGACAGAVIYEFGGAILFPLAETFRPTAKEITPRLFAHLVVALSIAAGALFIATQITLRRSKPHPDR